MGELSSAYEILTGPVTVYFAEVGTAFPSVDADMSTEVDWTSFGESDEGVTITFNQTIEKHRTAHRTGAVKASRTEEDPVISLSLVVATLENMAEIFETTVDTVAAGTGTPGTKTVGLYRGREVAEKAFLLRGSSPYGNYPAQYQLPRGFIGGNLEIVHNKEGKAVLPIEINILEDLNAASEDERFGALVAQTEAAQ